MQLIKIARYANATEITPVKNKRVFVCSNKSKDGAPVVTIGLKFLEKDYDAEKQAFYRRDSCRNVRQFTAFLTPETACALYDALGDYMHRVTPEFKNDQPAPEGR
ncbi:hypothetical protein LL912_00770 [Niabella sp. CC-SYL272]|uniref:hypothetical protein n=1 Tax=Niabella agricola TaxID=2891571 RepID=UPI001F2224F9|nr:hypothetical protein [Niabella agricola]MCF3107299.1 hypothetical protein [Niabella agricola]